MKTKFVICDSQLDAFHCISLISEYYKTYDEEDGHKIFLVDRKNLYQMTNFNDKENKELKEEREVIFSNLDVFESLQNGKDVVSQLSASKITRGRNSRKTCEDLINWLLCKPS